MRLIIENDYQSAAKWTADYIAKKINSHAENRPFVLGLPTGSSPIGTYKELILLYKNGKVSFKNVITFNMDEYVGLAETHPQSYHFFMHENFFNHIDILPENINIPNGNAQDLDAECKLYEEKIASFGGIDLFLGGMGEDGHLAFNEPGSSLQSLTRVKNLNFDTINANSRFFENDIQKVPKKAVTVGIKTILDAREVIILSLGHRKARALHKAVEGSINHLWTASALQMHPKGIIVCDEEATYELKVSTYKYFKDIGKR
ncbi:MAG: glucosamine-6-phosphate deaminase [Marinilabiliaceae bacterium]|nr:glucosamine-6-phosphate deaminase [Marinilabiliaceae bacterium]